MDPNKIDFLGIFYFLASLIIVSICGYGLPEIINTINSCEEGFFYGYVASYCVSSLLFWLLTKDTKFFKKIK